jgi:hypothetical protein
MPQHGLTAFLVAFNGGHTSLVRLLADAKADVNHADVVRFLLSLW